MTRFATIDGNIEKAFEPEMYTKNLSEYLKNIRSITIKTIDEIKNKPEYSPLKGHVNDKLHKIVREQKEKERRELSINYQNEVIQKLEEEFKKEENKIKDKTYLENFLSDVPIYLNAGKHELYKLMKDLLPKITSMIGGKGDIKTKYYVEVAAKHIRKNPDGTEKTIGYETKKTESPAGYLHDDDLEKIVLGKKDKEYIHAIIDKEIDIREFLPEFDNYNPETDFIEIRSTLNAMEFEYSDFDLFRTIKNKKNANFNLWTRVKNNNRMKQKISDYFSGMRNEFPYDPFGVYTNLDEKAIYEYVNLAKSISVNNEKYPFETEFKPGLKEVEELSRKYPDLSIHDITILAKKYDPKNLKKINENAEYAGKRMDNRLSDQETDKYRVMGLPQVQVNFYRNGIRFEHLIRGNTAHEIAKKYFSHGKHYDEFRDDKRKKKLAQKDLDMVTQYFETNLEKVFPREDNIIHLKVA